MGCGSSSQRDAAQPRVSVFPNPAAGSAASPAATNRMTMAATGQISSPAEADDLEESSAAPPSKGSGGGSAHVNSVIASATEEVDLTQEEGKIGNVFPVLTIVPAALLSMRGLLRLKIAGNNFSAAPPDALCTLTSLLELDISRCALKELPKSIGSLSALTELSASENDLTELPSSIGKLRNLVKLALFKNKLLSLPDTLAQCEALEEVSTACGCSLFVRCRARLRWETQARCGCALQT